MRAADAWRWAAVRLAGETARLEAELIVAHLLGIERAELLLDRREAEVDAAALQALVARRLEGEPLAYIVGHKEFWSLDFRVGPSVLIPRPDSETLMEAAIARHPPDAPLDILDLGTGSGCLLLAALSHWPRAFGIGVDRSPAAIAVARENSRRLQMDRRAAFLAGDWADAIDARFDLIFANPPYVRTGDPDGLNVARFEPPSALFAGDDGVDAYRRIIPALDRLLRPGGTAHLEIGSDQGDVLVGMASDRGFRAAVSRDLAGRARCVTIAAGSGL